MTIAQSHLAGQFPGGCLQPLGHNQRQGLVKARSEAGKGFQNLRLGKPYRLY